MPITAENKSRYPPAKEWRAIRASILDRAGNCCETCGVANRALGIRLADGRFVPEHEICIAHDLGLISGDQAAQPAYVRIVLTIAHLDHMPEHNDPANLSALCQRCHNRYDTAHRQANAKATRERRKRDRQLALEGIMSCS